MIKFQILSVLTVLTVEHILYCSKFHITWRTNKHHHVLKHLKRRKKHGIAVNQPNFIVWFKFIKTVNLITTKYSLTWGWYKWREETKGMCTYLREEGEGGGEEVSHGELHQEVVHPGQLGRWRWFFFFLYLLCFAKAKHFTYLWCKLQDEVRKINKVLNFSFLEFSDLCIRTPWEWGISAYTASPLLYCWKNSSLIVNWDKTQIFNYLVITSWLLKSLSWI